MGEHFVRYDSLTAHKAPDAVGMYAWYGRLDAGILDWQYELVEGKDVGINRFRILLQKHTSRFTPPPLVTTAATTFSALYKGTLEEQGINFLRSTLDAITVSSAGQDDVEATSAKLLLDAIEQPKVREWLVKIFSVVNPIVSAPIYIGVAKSLNDRLGTHVNHLQKFSAAIAKEPLRRKELLQASKSSFGSRAIGMGFTIESLEVWTLNLEQLLDVDNPSEKDKLRAVAEAAEWLLNRWHRPMLGRK
jgi:hypothetical protein